MKKFFSWMLAVSMLFVLTAAAAENGDLTGSWYTQIYGMTVELALNEDGTAVMAGNEGTWALTEAGLTVTIDGSDAEGTVTDGVLTLSQGEESYDFTREAPAAIEIAKAKAGAAVEDYSGTYEVVYLNLLGNYIDMETAAEYGIPQLSAITIENGQFTLGEANGENDNISPYLAMFAGEPTELEDGVLVCRLTSEAFTGSLTFTLLEDGMISVTIYGGDTELFNMIYAPAAENAAE